ncbi:MAG: SO_0444 family Cu/Zn efflux transporter [Bacteroidaceae bacterium]|nr:SO_0444 family Cu/Zn efflux transporter [Bacteroidaceae bacterium]
MDLISSILTDIWHICNSMSPYILLGFLLAGLLHEFVPADFFIRNLSGKNFRSVLLSALFGIPLPLCSCGVIPTAMGLRREGISKGATVSFLIATPQTGVDSIIATYSLMGLPFALLRPFVALSTALFGGSLINWFDSESETQSGNKLHKQEMKSKGSFGKRMASALRYGMVDMIADIGKWLIIGLITAGIITTLVPAEWFSVFQNNSLLSMLAILMLSIPMYLCATGSIPIAVALMLKGLSPGCALVLLLAGPASNMASILVIKNVLGKRTLFIYLLSIVIGAIVFGLGIDYLLPREWFTENLVSLDECCHPHSQWFPTICTLMLALLLLHALFINKLNKKCQCQDHSCCNSSAQKCVRRLSVRGMHCNHCAANVQKALSSVNGITHAEVSLELSHAEVSGEDYNPEEVIQAVKSLGFDAEWTD